ncbi:MAG: hypothetical protein KF688_17025 [Pirellulales bacterium]|nr:hypothetical protein [Pirellulales bacterium]
MPVVFADDFEKGMDRWQTTDPDPAKPFWKVIETTGPAKKPTHVLRVTGLSDYKPPFRSPHSIALAKDVVVGDFELTVKVQNTKPDAGPHRDLCLFWGHQDPAKFYYVHFGAVSDPNACQIFIVNKAARTPITVKTAKGTPWRDGWHTVKVVRRVDDGAMEVYFDDMDEPLMTAEDKTFAWGRVGLGTFDDHGNFDEVVLRGVKVEPPK